MMIILVVGLIKKILYKKISYKYLSKPGRIFGGTINNKVDLSNYRTKLNLKNATGIDTSKLEAKFGLVSLKAEIYIEK